MVVMSGTPTRLRGRSGGGSGCIYARSPSVGAADLDDDLADRVAISDVAQRSGRLAQREGGTDMGPRGARPEHLEQLALIPLQLVGHVRGEVAELEAADLHALQHH